MLFQYSSLVVIKSLKYTHIGYEPFATNHLRILNKDVSKRNRSYRSKS
jgi:hypothetical protein